MAQPSVLKANTRVGSYTIIESVDINSHSVVYRARVGDTDEYVWLQEYMPRDLAGRQQGDDTVRPRRGKSKTFEEGLTLFLQEARVLSQIHDPYVARVREYTESGGTAFIAMDQELGITLKEHLDQHGKLPQEELRSQKAPDHGRSNGNRDRRAALPARSSIVIHGVGCLHWEVFRT